MMLIQGSYSNNLKISTKGGHFHLEVILLEIFCFCTYFLHTTTHLLPRYLDSMEGSDTEMQSNNTYR